MNEQIKALMGQTLDEKFSGTWSTMDMQDLQKFTERFAELIVRECIAQCWTVSELESNGYVVSECSKKIRKHFGVEE
jgi:hypothetical protein